MESINFIFFGRLEKEKWFDLILDLIEYFQWEQRIHFYIFWNGILKEKIPSFDNISFFGRKSKKQIQRYLKKSNFSLMPSRFLETFGLSALESLSYWVPVIGFKKWGLENFIFDELDINRQNWQTDEKKFINIIEHLFFNLSEKKYRSLSEASFEISDQYILKNWIQKFEERLPWYWIKRILLCSDFIQKIGWIENYICDVKEVLEKKGYKVELFWLNYKWKITKYFKYLWIFISFVNFLYAIKLKRKIKDFNPDLIWFHSVSRFLGHFSLKAVDKFNWEKWMMYHDLWYFHPFPAKLENVNQIEKKFCLKNFIKMSNTRNPFKILFVFWKYINLLFLKKTLKKNINKHLVPSEFMLDIVRQSYEVENISVFSHFLDK